MEKERRQSMYDIDNKLGVLLESVSNVKESVCKIENHLEKLNGSVQKNTVNIARLESGRSTNATEISNLRKNLNRVAFLLIGAIVAVLIEHITK